MMPNGTEAPAQVILASASATRAQLLRNAGIAITIHPANVDEDGVKKKFLDGGKTAAELAVALADMKAGGLPPDIHAGMPVIGADQTLECEGVWFDKPADMAQAATHLRILSGRTHILHSAVSVAREGRVVWRAQEHAQLDMRPLEEDFIHTYLSRAGPDVLGSVGAYRLEGLGARLFRRVQGDYFAILGLPLLALLEFLRREGVIS